MIQTFADKEHIVQAMRLTGTEASARALCRWLSISKWRALHDPSSNSQSVSLPGEYFSDGIARTANKGQWVVRTAQHIVEITDDHDFKARYERM